MLDPVTIAALAVAVALIYPIRCSILFRLIRDRVHQQWKQDNGYNCPLNVKHLNNR